MRYRSNLRSILPIMAAIAINAPACATKYTYVITGTTTNDVIDVEDIVGATLPIGAAFTLTYILDDAVPTASYAYGATASSATGVGAYNNGAIPPVAAMLMVDGNSYMVRQGNQYEASPPDLDPGAIFFEEDRGTAVKSVRTLKLDAQYTSFDRVADDSDLEGDELFMTLHSPDFTSADFRELGTFALTPDSTGFFLTSSQGAGTGAIGLEYESAGLSASSLTVTSDAVPEPTSWAMVIVGLLGAGIRVRRSRWVSSRAG